MTTNICKPLFRSLSAALLIGLAACSEPAETVSTGTVSASSTYNTSLDMMNLMNLVIEPVADTLWESAGWVLSEESGYEELYPTTEQEWLRVYNQSAMIVEIGNMLAIPERAQGRETWVTYSQAISTVGLQAMEATQNQDQEAYFQAGAQLYSVCTACHQAYNTEMSRFVSN